MINNKEINKRREIPKFTNSKQVRIPLADSPKKWGLVFEKWLWFVAIVSQTNQLK
jgi:hypothetical protein